MTPGTFPGLRRLYLVEGTDLSGPTDAELMAEVKHGDHSDFIHEGHRHAAHADHYDEH